jgi:hypothetical protein
MPDIRFATRVLACSGDIGVEARHCISDSPVISNFVKGKTVGAVSWIDEVHSKRELVLNPKPRHFKPFEYFDQTG